MLLLAYQAAYTAAGWLAMIVGISSLPYMWVMWNHLGPADPFGAIAPWHFAGAAVACVLAWGGFIFLLWLKGRSA